MNEQELGKKSLQLGQTHNPLFYNHYVGFLLNISMESLKYDDCGH